jgi:hypothetical protein
LVCFPIGAGSLNPYFLLLGLMRCPINITAYSVTLNLFQDLPRPNSEIPHRIRNDKSFLGQDTKLIAYSV